MKTCPFGAGAAVETCVPVVPVVGLVVVLPVGLVVVPPVVVPGTVASPPSVAGASDVGDSVAAVSVVVGTVDSEPARLSPAGSDASDSAFVVVSMAVGVVVVPVVVTVPLFGAFSHLPTLSSPSFTLVLSRHGAARDSRAWACSVIAARGVPLTGPAFSGLT